MRTIQSIGLPVGLLIGLALLAPLAAYADAGPFGIDHRINADNGGLWKRRNQQAIEGAAALAVVAGALCEGDQTRLGHASWQSIDSVAVGAVSAEVLKLVFARSRPTQTDNPNEWFQGRGHKSFPSGEVAFITSAVTPFVLEYGADHPAVYALELLPAVIAVGRVKAQAHWQSDVLAGWALGTAAGYYAHGRTSSLSVGLLPGGVSVGWHTHF
jgi:PAP2 superfamily